jgi:methionine synthase I (cobalamin-dependent)/5,10-methylenetetrahydrofolate reductase
MLYSRGVFLNRCFDELNLSNPGLVRAIHDEYLEAGADVVETNTFGAHRFKLGPHGLDPQVRKINREGARIAREAARGRGLVAGSMGPIGKPLAPLGHVGRDEALEAYREQAEGLLEGGVDVFLLETMPSIDQATAALEAVRSVTMEVPVAVSLTFNEEGNTLYGGDTPENVVARLEALGVPLIGANCSQGPQAMLETVGRMAAVARSARLSAMPNAGAPALVEGRYVYLCTPEYMATWARRFLEAGAAVVGGCCGTTPAHVRDLVRSVRMMRPARSEARVLPPARPREAPTPVPREAKSPLARRLGRKFVVSVELDPPRGADPGAILERAQYCRENEVDAINVADGPRASARMSAQALCVLLQERVGMDTILHYTCRDRNLLGMQSDLLGAHALGLRNILAITGDPPKLGDYPDATAVYDVDSVGLIRILDHLNHGCDLAGNLIGPALGIHVGCGADPSKPDMEREVRRLEEKVQAGAEFVMTQPVYDPRTLERFFGMIRHLRVPLLVGILPLYSHRNAEFLHNEVPGMTIPDDIRERMRRAGSGEPAHAEGVAIAREATLAAREVAQGVYVMPPFNKVDLAVRVIEVLH